MSDRDCENCKHKINGMCEKWKCEFEAKEILPSMEELLARAEAKGRAEAIKDIPKCKDCLHWKLLNVTKSYICDVFDWMSKEDDYCSFVEVKEQIGEKNEESFS